MSTEQSPSEDHNTLVVIFLRGGADALNLIIPHAEDAYYRARPTLGIPRPDDRTANPAARTIDIDGYFGFHPNLAPLLDFWKGGQLAAVHACGAPYESHSHFQASDLTERGVNDETGPPSGWIARHLAAHRRGAGGPLRAISVGERIARSMVGSMPVAVLSDVSDMNLSQDPQAASVMQTILEALYSTDEQLGRSGQESVAVIRALERLDQEAYKPSSGDSYPETSFGNDLQEVAKLIRAEVGVEVATIDLEGWDTHFAQGRIVDQLATTLAGGLAAFISDLHDSSGRVTVVVMSELGRRVAENASLGTDHGHGGLMLLLGQNVAGGVVHGGWPGLEEESLFYPGDLAVTTDYRDVLAEVIGCQLGNPDLGKVFPDFEPTHRGLFR